MCIRDSYDGHYTVTFQRAGGQFALGTMKIIRNAVTAEARSASGITFTATGTVDSTGIITIDVDNDAGLSVEIPSAKVTRGIVEASYTVEGEAGTIAGTKDGANIDQNPVTDFDGGYEVAFIREEEEVAATTFEVKRGVFETQITAEDESVYQIQGYVTSDGTVVLAQAVASVDAVILAEASIDQDDFDITGIYRAGDRVGTIAGRKGD